MVAVGIRLKSVVMNRRNMVRKIDRELMVIYLRKDIHRQLIGSYEAMGLEMNDFPPGGSLPAIAFDFWDSWIDEKNHGFPKFYELIEKNDWPALALSVVEDLEKGRDATHPVIVETFSRKK